MNKAIRILESEKKNLEHILKDCNEEISKLNKKISDMTKPDYISKLDGEYAFLRRGKSISDYVTTLANALMYELNKETQRLEECKNKLMEVTNTLNTLKKNVGETK